MQDTQSAPMLTPGMSMHDWLLGLERSSMGQRLAALRKTGLFAQAPDGSDYDKALWTMNRMRSRCGVLDDSDKISPSRADWCLQWATAALDGTEHQTDEILLQACRIIDRHAPNQSPLRATAHDLFFMIRGELP